jgi:hypothetical protein
MEKAKKSLRRRPFLLEHYLFASPAPLPKGEKARLHLPYLKLPFTETPNNSAFQPRDMMLWRRHVRPNDIIDRMGHARTHYYFSLRSHSNSF